jgi:hypothetical protein
MGILATPSLTFGLIVAAYLGPLDATVGWIQPPPPSSSSWVRRGVEHRTHGDVASVRFRADTARPFQRDRDDTDVLPDDEPDQNGGPSEQIRYMATFLNARLGKAVVQQILATTTTPAAAPRNENDESATGDTKKATADVPEDTIVAAVDAVATEPVPEPLVRESSPEVRDGPNTSIRNSTKTAPIVSPLISLEFGKELPVAVDKVEPLTETFSGKVLRALREGDTPGDREDEEYTESRGKQTESPLVENETKGVPETDTSETDAASLGTDQPKLYTASSATGTPETNSTEASTPMVEHGNTTLADTETGNASSRNTESSEVENSEEDAETVMEQPSTGHKKEGDRDLTLVDEFYTDADVAEPTLDSAKEATEIGQLDQPRLYSTSQNNVTDANLSGRSLDEVVDDGSNDTDADLDEGEERPSLRHKKEGDRDVALQDEFLEPVEDQLRADQNATMSQDLANQGDQPLDVVPYPKSDMDDHLQDAVPYTRKKEIMELAMNSKNEKEPPRDVLAYRKKGVKLDDVRKENGGENVAGNVQSSNSDAPDNALPYPEAHDDLDLSTSETEPTQIPISGTPSGVRLPAGIMDELEATIEQAQSELNTNVGQSDSVVEGDSMENSDSRQTQDSGVVSDGTGSPLEPRIPSVVSREFGHPLEVVQDGISPPRDSQASTEAASDRPKNDASGESSSSTLNAAHRSFFGDWQAFSKKSFGLDRTLFGKRR